MYIEILANQVTYFAVTVDALQEKVGSHYDLEREAQS